MEPRTPEGAETAAPPAFEERSLKVKASHVRVAGAVRVNEGVLEAIGVPPRGIAEVGFGTKSVAVHLFGDRHVPSPEIVLRPPDMKRLGVKEGEVVTLRSYVKGGAAVRGAFRRAGARLSRRMDLSEPESEGEE